MMFSRVCVVGLICAMAIVLPACRRAATEEVAYKDDISQAGRAADSAVA